LQGRPFNYFCALL